MVEIVSVGIACVSVASALCVYSSMKEKIQEKDKMLDKLSNDAQNILDKKIFFEQEVERLKNQIKLMEENEEESLPKSTQVEEKEYVYKKKYKGKVLVGNYHDYFLQQAREILRCFGLSVELVTTGEAIVEKIKNGEKFDMILTNNTYQHGIDGRDVVSQLHEIEGFNTPIVVQTIEQGNRENFMYRYGYDEYIEKPLQPDKMEIILDKFLKKAKKD